MQRGRIAAARSLIGMTQKDFAEAAGLELNSFATAEDKGDPYRFERILSTFAKHGIKFWGDEHEGIIYYKLKSE